MAASGSTALDRTSSTKVLTEVETETQHWSNGRGNSMTGTTFRRLVDGCL